MLLENKENWNEAVNEFREYLEQNPNIKNTLYKLSSVNANIYNNLEVQEGFKTVETNQGMKLSDSALVFFTDTLEYINKNFSKPGEQDMDLNHFIDERVGLLNATEAIVDKNEIDLDRSFRGIAFKKNRTAEEEVIYNTAKEFLEPAEFTQAINEDLSVWQVLSEVEQSRVRQFTKIFVAEKYQEKQRESVENVQESLGNPFATNLSYVGGLGKTSLDYIKPDDTPQTKESGPSQGIDI
jgi:hypothetical protein